MSIDRLAVRRRALNREPRNYAPDVLPKRLDGVILTKQKDGYPYSNLGGRAGQEMVNEAAGHQACVAFVTHRRPTAFLLFPTSPESPIRHVASLLI